MLGHCLSNITVTFSACNILRRFCCGHCEKLWWHFGAVFFFADFSGDKSNVVVTLSIYSSGDAWSQGRSMFGGQVTWKSMILGNNSCSHTTHVVRSSLKIGKWWRPWIWAFERAAFQIYPPFRDMQDSKKFAYLKNQMKALVLRSCSEHNELTLKTHYCWIFVFSGQDLTVVSWMRKSGALFLKFESIFLVPGSPDAARSSRHEWKKFLLASRTRVMLPYIL